MIPPYLNPTGYRSCIKVAGTSILPPLVTEEKRRELNSDKARAIEIEQKIKRKRSSIDSGVMTGSYIEHLKNGELQIEQGENISLYQCTISDFECNENRPLDIMNSTANLSSFPSDSFLKSALEDTEFRELFFYTAQKVFGDNKSVSAGPNENVLPNTSFPAESKETVPLERCYKDDNSSLTHSEITTEHLDPTKCNDDVSFSNVNKTSQRYPEGSNFENEPNIQDQGLVSPPCRIRRNSYTLESPSPVLLEHMAREHAEKRKEIDKWRTVSERKDKDKGLGFKAFMTTRKPRKMWKKHTSDSLNADNVTTKPNEKTFFSRLFNKKSKSLIKNNKTGFSLPSSSRTSPIQFTTTRSVDCIQSNLIENSSGVDFDLISKPITEVRTPLHADSETSIITCKALAGSNLSLNKMQLESFSTIHWLNNTNNSILSSCETDILVPPQVDPGDSASQISVISHSTLNKPEGIVSNSMYHNNEPQRTELYEVDESISVSSSLSLSTFLVTDDNSSRPSTAENLSVLFSELKLKHEQQLAELLKQQHQEKILLSKLHTNIEMPPSRSGTSISVLNLPYKDSNTPHLEKQSSCSRKLFSSQADHSKEVSNTDTQKAAAIKITAFARGYLTRRLLKTQKVQQLIDVIKESLNCAFTLQSETHLKKNDLDLHERLAHQLTSALYELQNIISAPVEKRMAIIAIDREKLRKPPSRPTSAVSSATQKRKLRKQQSLFISDNKSADHRHRTKSLCLSGNPVSGLVRSSSFIKSDVASTSSRKPWK